MQKVMVDEWLEGMALAAGDDTEGLLHPIRRLRNVPKGNLQSTGKVPDVLDALSTALQSGRRDGSKEDLALLFAVACEVGRQEALQGQAQHTAQLRKSVAALLEPCVANSGLLHNSPLVKRVVQVQRDTGCISEAFWEQAASEGAITWCGLSLATAFNSLGQLASGWPAGRKLARTEQLQKQLLLAAKATAGKMSARQVANSLNGIANLHRTGWSVAAADCAELVQAAERKVSNMNSQEVASLWRAVLRLKIQPSEGLRGQLLGATERVLPFSNAQDVASIWNGLHHLELQPEDELKRRLFLASNFVMPTCTDRKVVVILTALAGLRIQPTSTLRSRLLTALERGLPDCSDEEVANTRSALASLDIELSEAVQGRLQRASVEAPEAQT